MKWGHVQLSRLRQGAGPVCTRPLFSSLRWGWKRWLEVPQWEAGYTSPPSSGVGGCRLDHAANHKRECFVASWERGTDQDTETKTLEETAEVHLEPYRVVFTARTFLAPGNKMGMNLKFLLPFWMNSFWSWATHKHTCEPQPHWMRFIPECCEREGPSPVCGCKPCWRSSRRSPGQTGTWSPSRSTWDWWWWWSGTPSEGADNISIITHLNLPVYACSGWGNNLPSDKMNRIVIFVFFFL